MPRFNKNPWIRTNLEIHRRCSNRCWNNRSVGRLFNGSTLEASHAYDEHLAHHVNKIHSYFTGKSEAESFWKAQIFNTKTMQSPHTSTSVSVSTGICKICRNNFIPPLILWFWWPSQLRQHDQILNPYDCSGDWSSWCGREMRGKGKFDVSVQGSCVFMLASIVYF